MLDARSPYILVRDDFDVLDVTSSLEDLTQNILGDTGIQATDIQGPLVRLWRGATRKWAPAGRGQDLVATHGRGDSGRDWVGVGGDMQRRRRHVGVRATVLGVIVARSSSIGLRRRGKLASGNTRISHDRVGGRG